MATLNSVADYISEARILLQDVATPNRYADSQIVDGLNHAVNSASALRPDLFMVALRTPPIPEYSTSSTGTAVAIDARYKTALLYYIVGFVQLSDEEDTQDARASALLTKFSSQLMMTAG